MQLELDRIRVDGGTQPRAQLHADVVQEYAELMAAGTAFPPVVVFHDGEEYWLADGFHRLRAAMLTCPGQPIEADVRQGSLQDAQWFSYGVNQDHGLRRTNGDKVRAVRAALAHAKSAELSNCQIAAHCGVSEAMVRNHRPEGSASSHETKMRTVTRGGTTYQQDTAKIGKAGPPVAETRPRPRFGGVSPHAHQPIRGHGRVEPMTALNMPHDPVCGARALWDVFDADYLQTLVRELSKFLQGATP